MFEASEKAFKHAKNINDYCEITYILNKWVIKFRQEINMEKMLKQKVPIKR